MTRLAATLWTDVRVQYRNGFYVATALVVAASILLLRWLPAEAARLLLPAIILESVLVNTFYFASGLLLLERLEGTRLAQRVTPLSLDEYLGSKLVTLTAISLAESLTIALSVFGVGTWLIPMPLGVALAAQIFGLAGIALVVRYQSINEFLLPSVAYTSMLSLPLLGYFGVGSESWYLAHPVQGPLALMQIDASATSGELLYAVLYPLLWIVPLYAWTRRSLARSRDA